MHVASRPPSLASVPVDLACVCPPPPSHPCFPAGLPHKRTRNRDLDFSDNQLTGKLPTFLTAFTALTNLDLSNNRLAGPAPASLSTWFNSNSPTQHTYVHSAQLVRFDAQAAAQQSACQSVCRAADGRRVGLCGVQILMTHCAPLCALCVTLSGGRINVCGNQPKLTALTAWAGAVSC